jgi:hypothetical protein
MKIYHYSFEGEYVGESVSDLDPLEGKPLIPSHATIIAPPDAQAGKARVFDGTRWTLVTDNRGVWYTPDRTEIKLELIADVVSGGAARNIPPLTAAEIKVAALAALQAQIDTIEEGQRTAIREAVLNKAGAMGRLAAIDNQVASLRAQKDAL